MPGHSTSSVRLCALLLAAILMLLPARGALAGALADGADATVTSAAAVCCDAGVAETCVEPEYAVTDEPCPRYCMRSSAVEQSITGLPGLASFGCASAPYAGRIVFPAQTMRLSAASPAHRATPLIYLFLRLLN